MDGLVTINVEDAAFLTRMFGPRVPEGAPYLREAKGVIASQAEVGPAIAVLVHSIVHNGLGGGVCAGWTARQMPGGALRVSVLRFPDP